jgi:hypothetical protein
MTVVTVCPFVCLSVVTILVVTAVTVVSARQQRWQL